MIPGLSSAEATPRRRSFDSPFVRPIPFTSRSGISTTFFPARTFSSFRMETRIPSTIIVPFSTSDARNSVISATCASRRIFFRSFENSPPIFRIPRAGASATRRTDAVVRLRSSTPERTAFEVLWSAIPPATPPAASPAPPTRAPAAIALSRRRAARALGLSFIPPAHPVNLPAIRSEEAPAPSRASSGGRVRPSADRTRRPR